MTPTKTTVQVADLRNEDVQLRDFIERSMRQYAVLVVSDRAIPDARDGLKPVQRRILTAMHLMGLGAKTPHRKSARVVGDVLGKYHPHGDQSVYDALVRLAQPFSMRHPMIDGQGNFGSIDGDSAAAMRYTEARMTPLAELMMQDLEAGTVEWQPNFDDSMEEPVVLPAAAPNLLVNGSAGIAVGVSTNILPHNLGEICRAVDFIARSWGKRKSISVEELMKIVPGPDFPTGGTIFRYRLEGNERVDAIRRAYETGSSTINGQARIEIQPSAGGRSEIIVTELPYQVQKNTILERIAKDKDTGRFDGLADVRDESDYRGMRLVFETSRGADAQEVLARLLTYTQLRSGFSYNAMALVMEDGRKTPRVLTLAEMLSAFIAHRLEIIQRRSLHQKEKDAARLHIAQGLLSALAHIEKVIQLIRSAKDTAAARDGLMKTYHLTEAQANAILEMPLRRLASLEQSKLEEEAAGLKQSIARMDALIDSEKERLRVVSEEALRIAEKHGDTRRTEIIDDVPLTIAAATSARDDAPPPSGPRTVRLKAKSGLWCEPSITGKESAADPTLLQLTLDAAARLAIVTSTGQICVTRAGDLPDKTALADAGLERGSLILAIHEIKEDTRLAFFTSDGMAKIMEAAALPAWKFGQWKQAIAMAAGAKLAAAVPVQAGAQIFVYTCGAGGDGTAKGLRFPADEISAQASFNTKGVTAMKLSSGDRVQGVLAVDGDASPELVLVTAAGFARRMNLSEFSLRSRATQGIAASTVKTGGELRYVGTGDAHLLTLSSGKTVKVDADKIPATARTARGAALKSIVPAAGSEPVAIGRAA